MAGSEFPIRLGSILFTIVEPHRGHEVDYNRWYERDHFYAGCMVGPGILAGQRFVATRPYKELRYPAESPITPDPMTGSYLALYWIERSQQNEWGSWGAREVHRLHQDGRMFAERDHVHTKMYRYRWGTFRDPDGVPPELALDHRFPGLAVVFVEVGEGEDRDAAGDWFRDEHLPKALVGSSAAMALQFTPVPIPDDAPADVPRVAEDDRRILQMYFLDRDPGEVWDQEFAGLAQTVGEGGKARVVWASPFIPTVPGTDTYTDQLW
jgi:hypothetical protein